MTGLRGEAGECVMHYWIKVPPRHPPLFERIAELDTDSCEFVIARHPVSLLPSRMRRRAVTQSLMTSESLMTSDWATHDSETYIAYSDGGGGYALNRAAISLTQTNSSDPCLQIGDIGTAEQTLWAMDPIGIEVNESRHTVMFHYNGVCVNEMRSSHLATWYTKSGWYLAGLDHWDPIPETGMWDSMRAQVYSKFRNDLFGIAMNCPEKAPTIVQYWPNMIRGFDDGHRVYDWTWHKEGDCQWALTFYRVYWN